MLYLFFIAEIWSEGSQLFHGNYFKAIVLRNLFSNGSDRKKPKPIFRMAERAPSVLITKFVLIMCDY